MPRLLVTAAVVLLLGGFLARAGIYIAHVDFFRGISLSEFLYSALRGLRYDAAAPFEPWSDFEVGLDAGWEGPK